jgi:hypothetical protein
MSGTRALNANGTRAKQIVLTHAQCWWRASVARARAGNHELRTAQALTAKETGCCRGSKVRQYQDEAMCTRLQEGVVVCGVRVRSCTGRADREKVGVLVTSKMGMPGSVPGVVRFLTLHQARFIVAVSLCKSVVSGNVNAAVGNLKPDWWAGRGGKCQCS